VKLANNRTRRRNQFLAKTSHLFGSNGLIAHRRLARMFPEDGERLATSADLRRFNL